jgi:hypothetical protein
MKPKNKTERPARSQQHSSLNIRSTTTQQQDLTTAGQRRINIIWEVTQASIAVFVVASNMIVGILQGTGHSSVHEFPVILSSSLFLVVGFYFSRTNHAAIGGIGIKPLVNPYEGR